MFTEDQLLLIRKLQSSDLTLHSDATGSVVRKTDKLRKRILYYALVVRHPEAQISPLPLAEILNSEHTNVEITHFLSKLSYNLKKVLNKQTTVSHVEIDFSWPMLYSVCHSFNIYTLDLYLKDCWGKISQDEIGTHPINTVIHIICSAHIMHRFSYKIDRELCNKPKKETKRFIMFVMARLISCKTLDEFIKINYLHHCVCYVFPV